MTTSAQLRVRAPSPKLGRNILVCFLLGLTLTAAAQGHAVGENYVWFNVADSHIEGRFEIRLDDLRQVLGLEFPESYDEALKEVVAKEDVVRDYIRDHFRLAAGDGAPIPFEFTDTNLLRSDYYGHFAQYYYRTPQIAVPDEVEVTNELLFEGNDDRLYRSLLCIEFNRKSGKFYSEPGDPAEGETKRIEFAALVFGPRNSEQRLNLKDVEGLIPVREFLWQGILHIWIGIDHILFLVALLLPAVLIRDREQRVWRPVPRFRGALWNIAKIVTLFTVAHSISLSLAALDFIQLPSRLVESTIALSIAVVAANNIYPVFRETRWLVIFFFGLFHGLGFASVMGELPFRMVDLVKVVFLFNVGVEIGQIAIVAAVFPLIFFARKQAFYQPAVLAGGSVVVGLLSLWWFVERAFEL